MSEAEKIERFIQVATHNHTVMERATIVAWLRSYPSVIGLDEMTAWNVAAHIERGDHHKDTRLSP